MQGIATLPYEVVEVPAPLVPDNGVHTLKNAADMLADFGRHGDIYIAHVAEGETVIPLEVLNANPKMKSMIWQQFEEMGIDPEQYIVGNEFNMTNPATGVREFGFNPFKAVKKVFKKVTRTVKKVFKKIKPFLKAVAPILIGIAAPYLLPAAPLWLSAGIGSLAGSFVSGVRDPKQLALSFGMGAIGGGIKAKYFSGPGGSFFGSKTNPGAAFTDFGGAPGSGISSLGAGLTNVQNPLNPQTWGLESFNPLADPTAPPATSPTLAGNFEPGVGGDTSIRQLAGGVDQPVMVQTADGAAQLIPPDQAYALEASGNLVDGRLTTQGTDLVNQQAAWSSGAPSITDQAVGGPSGPPSVLSSDFQGGPPSQLNTVPYKMQTRAPTLAGDPPNWFERNIYDPAPNIGGQGEGILESYISPQRSGIQPDYGDVASQIQAHEQAWNLANPGVEIPAAVQKSIVDRTLAAAQPGMYSRYWPAATIGGAGAVAADYATEGQVLGLFPPDTTPEDTDGDGQIDQWRDNRTGVLYYEDPAKYGYGSDFYGENPYYSQQHLPTYVGGTPSPTTFPPPPVTVAGGGEIVGPGTATSDSIPALLSDGEFVVNAGTVSGIGGGNRREGARKLYAMQRAYDQRAA
ncbi:hypothetical protein CMO96_00560 [Candidatus Woesebacteria bacterium]|nr:hypothetical protein [Candidatus Woesebacteria bacterium]